MNIALTNRAKNYSDGKNLGLKRKISKIKNRNQNVISCPEYTRPLEQQTNCKNNLNIKNKCKLTQISFRKDESKLESLSKAIKILQPISKNKTAVAKVIPKNTVTNRNSVLKLTSSCLPKIKNEFELNFDTLPKAFLPVCFENYLALFNQMTSCLQFLPFEKANEIYEKYPLAFDNFSSVGDLVNAKKLNYKKSKEKSKNTKKEYICLPAVFDPIIEFSAFSKIPEKIFVNTYSVDDDKILLRTPIELGRKWKAQ